MNRFTEALQLLIGVEHWMASVLAILLPTLVIALAVRALLLRARRWAHSSANQSNEALLAAARKPAQMLIWLMGLGWVARALNAHWPEPSMLTDALQWRDVGLAVCAAWFLWGLIGRLTETSIRLRTEKGKDFDITTALALSKLLRLLVAVLTAVTVAHTLGFQVSGLLALGGVGGIAVGLAAKDLLANFFGGLTIYLDRPFSVGDWIRSPDKSIEGTVEYISWRHTRIRAFNKNLIYVPNSVFANIVVENPSRMSHRRLNETLSLRYEDFPVLESVVANIRTLLQNHPGIDNGQTVIVGFNRFGSSSLDITVYAFSPILDWATFQALKQELLLECGRIVARHGAEIAFPTQMLHMNALPAHPPPGFNALQSTRVSAPRSNA